MPTQTITYPTDEPASPPEDLMDISRQLADMKRLNDGWADGMQPAAQWGSGYGKAPAHHALDWLAAQFARRYAPGLPKPYLYPTPEGGVQAEWPIGSNEASLEIDLTTHTAEWYCLNFDTDASNEKTLDLDDAKSWRWIAGELSRMEPIVSLRCWNSKPVTSC